MTTLLTPRRAARAAFLAALLAAAACADHDPTRSTPGPGLPPAAAAVLRCTVDVRAGTLGCRPDGTATPEGVSAAILGGQGTNVRLASSGTSYDAGTTILRSDVTVENLTAQALGTADGATPAPEGVRVFFHTGPDVIEGVGAVAVANADGVGAFTGAAQPYFQYPGLLAPGDTTPAREWRFSVPPTVAAFVFTVYVAAAVPNEAGNIAVTPIAPSLVVGDTMRMGAVVRGVTGAAVPGAPVVGWTSSAPGVATVSASGLVTAVGAGTATLTATSGARTGSVSLAVSASASASAPEVTTFTVTPPEAEANALDSVTLEVRVRDAGAGILSARVTLLSPNGGFRRVCAIGASGRVSGTAFDGVYRCRLSFPAGSWNGAWSVEKVEGVGAGSRVRVVTTADLRAAGAPAHVYVDSPTEDSAPPFITNFTVRTPITAGVDSLDIVVAAGDAGIGIGQMTVTLGHSVRTGPGVRVYICTNTGPNGGGTRNSGFYRCGNLSSAGLAGGTWVVDSVSALDRNGNRHSLSTYQLDSAGFATEMYVNGDTVPPVLTAFSFSPATVAGNGADTVTVTLAAADSLSGLVLMNARFQPVGDPGRWKECYSGTFSARQSHSITCKLTFGPSEAGTWQVTSVYANDLLGNTGFYDTARLQAAGYPTSLTITP